jgi:hypothetical protein
MFKDSELDVSRAFRDVEILSSRYFWSPHLLNMDDLRMMIPGTVSSLVRYSGMWRKHSKEEKIAIEYYRKEIIKELEKHTLVADTELIHVVHI